MPAIKQVADPGLYPFGSEFFLSHAHLSLFAEIVGQTSRITRIPVDFVIFFWHAGSIFLLLLAVWQLLGICFENPPARWCGVALLAAALTVPVAGTALVIMDPYLTARSLSTPASLFAITSHAAGHTWWTTAWLLLTVVVHPQMALYALVFLLCLTSFTTLSRIQVAVLPIFPRLFDLKPVTGPAHEALVARTYFLVSNWAWYEWLGIAGPMALIWWISRQEIRGTKAVFRLMLRAMLPFGVLFSAAGLLLASSPRFENLTRLQPMRAFHLLYLVFFAFAGGLLGEFVLRRQVWRWVALFIPLACGMSFVQRSAYPGSLAIEFPGIRDVNVWNKAFYWIRGHTPKDAVFALDPGYMLRQGEDMHGFRAIAERSMLADAVKDSGAVSLFPQLADEWRHEVDAQRGLEQFQSRNFEKLAHSYPVTWIVTRQIAPEGLACPYHADGLSVCRIHEGP